MISFEEALELVLSHGKANNTEHIKIPFCLNRTLAEDIGSDIDMPPFNKSAMDGFACRKEDLGKALEVIEEIPAGTVPFKKIGLNQCSRIMTGAMVPEGADFILMLEHSRKENNKIIAISGSNNANICYQAEDVKSGDIVITKNTIILPQHIAILASVGVTEPLVYKIPEVAILSTGSELVEPEIKPDKANIRNSNGYQLQAQVMQLGITPNYMGIVDDDMSSLKTVMENAIEKNDVLLISGGVSVGDYDYVPTVLKQLGIDIIFHGLTAKPGKHLLFGKKKDHYIFGLPGNPVSSFVQFELLIKPLLQKMTGRPVKKNILQLPLQESFSRKKSNASEFIPVKISPVQTVLQIEYHGSAHIHAYTQANAIMDIPIGISQIKEGGLVNVRPL